MSATTRHRNGRKSVRLVMAIKTEVIERRRWACPSPDCTQERITPLDTVKAPICPVCSVNMTKRRKVTRRRVR
jgi:hypothetical protein